MAHSFQGNNDQYKVSERFAQLKVIQKQKKDEVRNVLVGHILPAEIWEIILSMAFAEKDVVGYFAFKRKDSFYNDDHYIFEGTEEDLSLAIIKMRSVVNLFDIQDDTPTDTYCSGFCEMLEASCPDEQGNRCECRWRHRVFDSVDDYEKYFNFYHIKIRVRNYVLSENGLLRCLQ